MDINSWLPLQRKSCLAGPMRTVGLTITCLQEMVYQALYFCRACEIFRCWFEEAETSLGASFLWDFFSLLQINYIWLREPGHCEVSTDTISENCLICRGERFLLLHETAGKTARGQFFSLYSFPIKSTKRLLFYSKYGMSPFLSGTTVKISSCQPNIYSGFLPYCSTLIHFGIAEIR